MTSLVRDVVVACLAYLLFVYGAGLALSILAFFENRSRVRESEAEGWDTIGRSRFTIPVSVIAPMHNEEVLGVPAVEALLELDYPEFEVIVVNDGSTDATLARLTEAFDLQPFERFERKVLPSREVYAVYRSQSDERLTVIDKEAGGNKADSLNSGINFARFRYVCCVDGDTIYARDALLSSMRLILRDPARVIGADEPDRRRNASRASLQEHCRTDREHAAAQLPAPGVPALVSEHAARVEPDELHDLHERRVHALQARRARGGRRLFSRLQLRGHRADVPRARAFPSSRAAVQDSLDAGARRPHRRTGPDQESHVAAGALAARDARDRVALPAHGLQPALRALWHARDSVLHLLRGACAVHRGDRTRNPRGRGDPRRGQLGRTTGSLSASCRSRSRR